MCRDINVIPLFKSDNKRVKYSSLESGDIAFCKDTGEYIMGGYPDKYRFDNLSLILVISHQNNYGKYIVFASLLEENTKISIKANTEHLINMFETPHSYLLMRLGNEKAYDVLEPTWCISTDEVHLIKIGSINYI